jgi:IclR family transcriptional regulator, acetate operon repressor
MMPIEAASPRSLIRVIGLFEAIAGAQQGLSLVDLSNRLDSPKSSLLLLLRPLVAQGHLLHADGRYRLGPAAFRLASLMLAARRLPGQVREAMEWLAQESGETVILTAIERESGTVTYLDVIPSEQPVRYVVPAGSTRPLYTSAAGRVLLAFQDEGWLQSYLKRTKLKPMTPHSVTSIAALREILRQTRLAGVAVTFEETILGAAGCAAPIFESDGSVATALLIGGPAERFRQGRERLTALAQSAAARASSGSQPALDAEG